MKIYISVITLILLAQITNAQTFVNIESGVLFTGLNNIRNGTNGTLFSLKNDLSTPPSPFLRLVRVLIK